MLDIFIESFALVSVTGEDSVSEQVAMLHAVFSKRKKERKTIV